MTARTSAATPRLPARSTWRSPGRRVGLARAPGGQVAAYRAGDGRDRASDSRQLPVPAGSGSLPAAALRTVRAGIPPHGDPDTGLERGGGDRGLDRAAHAARLPAPGTADLRRR